MIISGEAAGYTKVDVDVDSARRALTTLCQTPEYARAGATFDVWSLPDGTVCFRILPRAVGLSVARRATITVGGAKMDVFMCYIANTVASSDVTYKKMLEDWLVSTLSFCQRNLLTPCNPKCTKMVLLLHINRLLRLPLSAKRRIWLFHNSAFASALIQSNFEAVGSSAEHKSHDSTCNLETYCNRLPLSALLRRSVGFLSDVPVNSHASTKIIANFTSVQHAEGQPRSSIVQRPTSQIKQQRQLVGAPHLFEQVEMAPCHDRVVSCQDTFSDFQLL
jgi:hypothetical protein